MFKWAPNIPLFSFFPAMTDRSNFGYPPININYTPEWNGVSQQPPDSALYYHASYTTLQGHSRSSSIPYSAKPLVPNSMNQNAPYASYPPNSNRFVHLQQQQMFSHPPSQQQQQQFRHPVIQHHHPIQSYSPAVTDPSHLSHSPPQYNQTTLYSPPIETGSHYPASPNRPFSCDMCPLSFNRQHDLKRHRETHSGEKPFPCGACGKTFTRKDALKRHQIVKNCGHDDQS